MKKLVFLVIFLPLWIQQVLAQVVELDSLVKRFDMLAEEDSIYVDLANEIAVRYGLEDPNQAASYINMARSAAQRLGYDRGLIRSLTLLGNSHLNVGLPDQALSYYLKAMELNKGQFLLDYIRLHNNIGETYRRKGLYDSSRYHFNKALELVEANEGIHIPVIIYSNLGEVNLMMGKVAEARSYFKLCLENAFATNHRVGIGYGYFGLAECFSAEENYDSAIYWQRKAIQVREECNHQRGLIQSFLGQGANYYQMKSDSSLYFWNLAATYSYKNDAFDLLIKVFDRLYDYHLHTGDLQNAALILNKNKAIRDSLSTLELNSRMEQIERSLEAEALVLENQILLEQQARIKANSRLQLVLFTIIALVVIGLIIYYYKNQRKSKQIELVSKENIYSEVLLQLSSLINQSNFDPEAFIQNLLEQSRIALRCDRATYWVYDAATDCINLRKLDEHNAVTEIPERSFNLEEYRSMEDLFKRSNAVDDLSTPERFKNIYQDYFKPAGIRSMINSSILLDDQFYGFISFSVRYNRVRKWDTQDENFVSTLTDLIKIAKTKARADALQEEKEGLFQKVQTKNKSLREFNSVISHNLREPLTQIIGFVDLLKSIDNDVQSQSFSNHIAEAALRIDTVIKDLSTVLNEDDPHPADFQLISISAVIAEVKELLKPQLKDRDVEFSMQLSPDTIPSYKPFLVDIFYHLVSNSIKFSDPDKPLTLTISTSSLNNDAVIVYTDNGWGMDLTNFGDKVFKMYQRYHLDVEGRGIGLFIVKNRITSLGGRVKLVSEEGKGSTFEIGLPEYMSTSIN